ncbi:Cytoplasmic glyoxalase II [Exophiala xenobiotica]|uniref:hydroxyacylglutathione hydrolase n=1 Tax=Lithohypha guttulata TaxID=1690604 RepID=A0ABR0KEM9_9EURO|nr:Cytoplasmic glyoxalase II [Lithohypha guttulata]KAK5321484.1 Cytoplasmic glyoxalase II [Exophiala xenobiotica]
MHIQSIPMWVGSSNNYAYIVSDEATKEGVIIDPANPDEAGPPLQKAIKSGDLKLKSIVNTHHHWDHSGGNSKILSALPDKVPIIGGKDCQAVSETPADRSKFSIGKNIEVTALYTPCHTQDSICWFMEDKSKNERAVFTGDTLFIGGCGRFFEGTATEMNTALNKTLASLPDDTKVFPGHEYTKQNVKFLIKVAPDDAAVQRVQKLANDNKETQGMSTIGEEKKHNLFMRVDTDEMRKATGKTDPNDVMSAMREMKNNS